MGLFSRKKKARKDILTPEEIVELELLKQQEGVKIYDPTKNKNKFSLKILDAYSQDVGRGVARIDSESMHTLYASTGDVIEIIGKSRTVAKCLPLHPSDEGKGIIRIDGLGRNNSGTEIDDTITVRKIIPIEAEKVLVAPLETIPKIDERYLADSLEGVHFIKGDIVMVEYFGGRLIFQVIGVTPIADASLVTQKTVFHIAKRGEYIIGANADDEDKTKTNMTHLDIIKERYAKGEITREQFLEMKEDLKD